MLAGTAVKLCKFATAACTDDGAASTIDIANRSY
jgi:hypothetical protein